MRIHFILEDISAVISTLLSRLSVIFMIMIILFLNTFISDLGCGDDGRDWCGCGCISDFIGELVTTVRQCVMKR